MKERKFSEYYKLHAEEIFKFCRFKLSNTQEAEDLTSEVFIDLFKQELKDESAVKAWLYKVARHKIYDHYNKPLKQVGDINSLDMISEGQIESHLKQTEQIAIDKALIEKFETELKNLDEQTSEIIVLKLWDEFNFKEIAEILDIKLSSVKMRFYRGVEQIKANLSMEVKQEKSYKLNSFAFIFAGIIGITSQPAYAFSAVSTSLSAGVGGILGINLVNTSTTSVSTSLSAFLTTITGKVLLGTIATATVITGMLGSYTLVGQGEEIEPEPLVIHEEQQIEYKIFESDISGISIELPKNYDIEETVIEGPSPKSILSIFSNNNFFLRIYGTHPLNSSPFEYSQIQYLDLGVLQNNNRNIGKRGLIINTNLYSISYSNEGYGSSIDINDRYLWIRSYRINDDLLPIPESQIEIWDRIVKSIEFMEVDEVVKNNEESFVSGCVNISNCGLITSNKWINTPLQEFDFSNDGKFIYKFIDENNPDVKTGEWRFEEIGQDRILALTLKYDDKEDFNEYLTFFNNIRLVYDLNHPVLKFIRQEDYKNSLFEIEVICDSDTSRIDSESTSRGFGCDSGYAFSWAGFNYFNEL